MAVGLRFERGPTWRELRAEFHTGWYWVTFRLPEPRPASVAGLSGLTDRPKLGGTLFDMEEVATIMAVADPGSPPAVASLADRDWFYPGQHGRLLALSANARSVAVAGEGGVTFFGRVRGAAKRCNQADGCLRGPQLIAKPSARRAVGAL